MAKPKNTRKSRRKGQKHQTPPSPGPSRRDVLKLARMGAVGAVVAGGGGWFALGSFRAWAAEHDLSRIGQGKPTVVQVHDPQCPTCTALQKQTRQALRNFGECDLLYLVADIKTQEGQRFAVQHGVPHVTLVIFDKAGNRQEILSGMRSSEDLVPVFRRYQAVSG
ncbi:twin-arginine translocation signal domain-containing protein [uncultured Roseobacter sp.]|uniref:twin-arginine translocation signal domain-containing protein n=1 Tax=uncultured Roseobacter sp. TaxID=114847 RepID=UPI002620883B|nr:twin-arginine translocation signal domain-containing protein [uncultured Roseobacter sp.]